MQKTAWKREKKKKREKERKEPKERNKRKERIREENSLYSRKHFPYRITAYWNQQKRLIQQITGSLYINSMRGVALCVRC